HRRACELSGSNSDQIGTQEVASTIETASAFPASNFFVLPSKARHCEEGVSENYARDSLPLIDPPPMRRSVIFTRRSSFAV
ncbi:MAG: hypothetical protein WA376_02385, partial [Terrimicrobiaceae bacterium]